MSPQETPRLPGCPQSPKRSATAERNAAARPTRKSQAQTCCHLNECCISEEVAAGICESPIEMGNDGLVAPGITHRHSLWTNADDRLALDPLCPVEGGDGIVEGRDVADVRPQPTIPYPLDELTQWGGSGYDDEVDSQAARGPRLGRAGNGHQRSSGTNHARRPLRDVAAEDIENQIDPADIFQGVVIEVDELLCAEVESRLAAGSAPGADDVRAGLTCELGRHRTDYACRTMHEEALPRTKAAVLEQ